MTEKERRRLRRRVWFWRIATLIVVIVLIAGWLREEGPSGPYIARYNIDGVIYDDPKRDDLLDKIAKDKDAKALMLRINSPGGTTAGSEALYDSIRKIAESKKVVAVMTEVAASGAYIAAISADHIVARGNTLTGSIGVIAETPNFTGLMDKVGVSMEQVKSSPLKGAPSPYETTTPEVRKAQAALVEDGYQWFRGLVGERRSLDDAALDKVADGRVFSGRQAIDNGLIDEIGGETEALAWLSSVGVESDLPVEDRVIEKDKGGFLDFAESWFMARITGRSGGAETGMRLLSVLK